jgi:hydrogenase maturation factor HypF (carbamoyltransferase family)
MTTPLLKYIVEHREKDQSRLAATAEHYIAEGLYRIAEKEKKPIVFSGGCAYNRIMTEFMIARGVLLNKEIPPGDGGISAGQIAFVLADPRNDIS